MSVDGTWKLHHASHHSVVSAISIHIRALENVWTFKFFPTFAKAVRFGRNMTFKSPFAYLKWRADYKCLAEEFKTF